MREGVDLDRSTLAGWVGATSELLAPLVEAVRKHAMSATIHTSSRPNSTMYTRPTQDAYAKAAGINQIAVSPHLVCLFTGPASFGDLQASLIEVFYLPSYAPELNPDERLNASLKHSIATRVPMRTKPKLQAVAERHMSQLNNDTQKVRAFFQYPTVKHAA